MRNRYITRFKTKIWKIVESHWKNKTKHPGLRVHTPIVEHYSWPPGQHSWTFTAVKSYFVDNNEQIQTSYTCVVPTYVSAKDLDDITESLRDDFRKFCAVLWNRPVEVQSCAQ